MTTLMIILLCVDVILLSALFSYVVIAILNKDIKKKKSDKEE